MSWQLTVRWTGRMVGDREGGSHLYQSQGSQRPVRSSDPTQTHKLPRKVCVCVCVGAMGGPCVFVGLGDGVKESADVKASF